MINSIPESVKVWSQFGHPILMWVLLGISLYALYTGLQARSIRTAPKEERKELIKQNPKDKHHKIGSILLALVVLGTIGGMTVTYINNGKLFVGAHLIAGLGMMAILVTSVSLVPYMQKGNNIARNTHIFLNVVMLGIFGWQGVTGMQIVQRILSKM